jgi:diaminopimelate epimerase
MPTPPPPPAIRLTKHQALGNDFLVALDAVNGRALDLGPTEARSWCHRHLGIGADGLIHGAAPSGDGADVVMHLYNADGSRAEISGNGIRCLAQAVMSGRGRHDPLVADTDAGRRRIAWVDGPDDLRHGRWSVDMGRWRAGPAVGSDAAALLRQLSPRGRVATVDMGNPHLVVAVDDLDAVDVAEVGATVEASFEGGVNVEFVRFDPAGDGSRVDLRVWERGVGATEACGSGACATAVAVRRWGMASSRVEVGMPGGTVEVGVAEDGEVVLVGESTFVADVEVPGA